MASNFFAIHIGAKSFLKPPPKSLHQCANILRFDKYSSPLFFDFVKVHYYVFPIQVQLACMSMPVHAKQAPKVNTCSSLIRIQNIFECWQSNYRPTLNSLR